MNLTRIKTTLRQFGYDIGHFPDWRLIFKEIDLLVDVGANHGQTYDYFRSMGWQGPVVSYEGWEPTFRKLMNRHGIDWYRRCAMLSDCAEEVAFYVQSNEGHDGTNSVLVKKNTQSDILPKTVHTKRLDDEPITAQRILLKIDAEGHDLKVFEGASEMWPRIPWVMMEVSLVQRFHSEPIFGEIVGRMLTYGYELAFLDRQYSQPGGLGCEAADAVFRRT